jgi:hypothetical protein
MSIQVNNLNTGGQTSIQVDVCPFGCIDFIIMIMPTPLMVAKLKSKTPLLRFFKILFLEPFWAHFFRIA